MKNLSGSLLAVLFVAVLLPTDASARTETLWKGLMSFEKPAKSKIQREDTDGYLLQPRKSGRRVAVLLAREDLGPGLTKLSNQQLASKFRKRLTEEWQTVRNFKVSGNTVTGKITGKAVVPWSKREVRFTGEFRLVRVKPSLVVGAIVVSPPGDFGKPYVRPFRRVVKNFKTGRR